MKIELKELQREIARELLNDEKFIEATLQAIKDMKIEIDEPVRVAVS